MSGKSSQTSPLRAKLIRFEEVSELVLCGFGALAYIAMWAYIGFVFWLF